MAGEPLPVQQLAGTLSGRFASSHSPENPSRSPACRFRQWFYYSASVANEFPTTAALFLQYLGWARRNCRKDLGETCVRVEIPVPRLGPCLNRI